MKISFKNHLLEIRLILPILLILGLSGCKDNDPISKEKASTEVLEINTFIHDNMSFYYFWNEDMPDVDPEYELDSEDYFYQLLKTPDDKWSFITDDYSGLLDYFAGIQKTVGYSILPAYLNSTSDQVVAFIEYVYRDSPASQAGLKRGDIIYKIDGQTITGANYQDLLTRETFVLTLGELNDNNSITELSPSLSLSAIELNQHPIVASSIIDTLGHKIGYLAYTSFTANYDTALVNTFIQFKAAGVTELVLDLRYNGGGSVSTAALLGDILVPPGNQGNTFIQQVFNNTWSTYLKEKEGFTDESFKIPFESNSDNLNISKLYALTTPGTASASEMVIYGLDPYMDVVQIGDTTLGKYYGSITLDDEEEHNWAIQPLVMRSINATNDIDYSLGLLPDYYLPDYFYLFPADQLGDPNEVFLSKAISLITGQPFPYQDRFDTILKSASTRRTFRPNYSLRDKLDPLRKEMYIEHSSTQKP
jgi:hypothetical protein